MTKTEMQKIYSKGESELLTKEETVGTLGCTLGCWIYQDQVSNMRVPKSELSLLCWACLSYKFTKIDHMYKEHFNIS